MLDIRANNVDVDMRGHVFSRNGRPVEITAVGFNIGIRNGTIENGTISIETPDSPSYAINSSARIAEPKFKPETFALIENIDIKDGMIFIVSANASIRNSQVMMRNAELLAPVLVWGPDPVIENNKIWRRTAVMSGKPSYGIYLRYGNDATIRHNTIKNEGGQDEAIAFGLRKSQGVAIKDNALVGFGRPGETIDGSDHQFR